MLASAELMSRRLTLLRNKKRPWRILWHRNCLMSWYFLQCALCNVQCALCDAIRMPWGVICVVIDNNQIYHSDAFEIWIMLYLTEWGSVAHYFVLSTEYGMLWSWLKVVDSKRQSGYVRSNPPPHRKIWNFNEFHSLGMHRWAFWYNHSWSDLQSYPWTHFSEDQFRRIQSGRVDRFTHITALFMNPPVVAARRCGMEGIGALTAVVYLYIGESLGLRRPSRRLVRQSRLCSTL